MKNFSLMLILVLQAFLFSQNHNAVSMKPILSDALTYIQIAEDNGYEIVRMEFDIVSQPKSTFRELHEGWSYGIIAFGDDNIIDIDIEVYKEVDGQWIMIQEDNEVTSYAALDVTPTTSGVYRIDIISYEFAKGSSAGHYGMLIFHE